MQNYLISEVICPIFLSLLILIFNSNKYGQIISFIATILNLGFLIPIYKLISEQHKITYLLGGYENSYGIELELNFYSFIFLVIINISAFTFNVYKLSIKDISYIKNALILLCIAGFNGIIMSNDLFNIYVFLELSSIASYGLLASSEALPTLKAAFDYLIFGTIGASFYLIGIAFIYMLTGSLNITHIVERTMIYDGYSSGFLWLSFFFITLGFFIKLGIFPIHKWLIEVYHKSEAHITMFFSFSSSVISLYLLSIFLFNIYGVWNTDKYFKINDLLQFIGIFSAIYFGWKAFMENENKKILIYSSFSQIGYIINTLGFTYNTYDKTSIHAFTLQIITNAISKPILFVLLSDEIIKNFDTSKKRMFHIIISSFLILNLLGVPPLLGFFGKFYMLSAIIEQRNWINLGFIGVAIIFSCFYSVKLIHNLLHDDHRMIDRKKNNLQIESYAYAENKNFLYTLVPAILICGTICIILIFSNYLSGIVLLSTNNLLLIR
jgi:formate hydrogenlyase subunit 3/multisubunit Na+/H+ antiporter MnhD subunit